MFRSSAGRGIGVLAVAVLVAATFVLTPAFGAGTLTRAKVKKIAKRQATKVLTTLGPGMFIDEGTDMFRYQRRMNTGQPDQPLATFGPFTLKTHCEETGGNILAQVLISTSQPGSILDSYAGYEENFDPADGFLEWMGGDYGIAPGGGNYDPTYDMVAHAASPNGTAITGFSPVYYNVGAHCLFTGFIVAAPAL
jgi:hypothetical protein